MDMRFWRRFGAGAAVVLMLIGLVATAEIARFRFSVPDYSRTVRLHGLSSPVQILRDTHGIPHILAHSRRDAVFALGYVQAQDRLWQMVFLRAVMQARVAEIVGPDGAATDVLFRTLGLYRLAEQSVAHLDLETRGLLEAYAAGVNAYIAGHKGPLPIEFALLHISPRPWRPADSIATLKYMQFSLSENMYGELARAHLAAHLTNRQIEQFLPPFPGDPPNPLPDYLSLFHAAKSAGLEKPDTTASNNWVVAGFRSVTGAPLLANDPHLPLTVPSIWYLAHLSWPGHDVVGGVLPGMPAVSVGRTRDLAWGMTNTGPDTQDLYLEKLSPDGKAYITPTGPEPFVVRHEIIGVRFAKPLTITVRETRHGPVFPGDWRRVAGLVPKGYVLALSWTALSADDKTIQASLKLNDIDSGENFAPVLGDYLSPMQNIVWADRKHIGLILASRIPVRDPANDSLGLVPAKGWDARYDWKGYLPMDEMPRVDDPPSGQIATANNKTVPLGYPHTLSREWDAPFRFWRIDKMLSETRRHSIESFKAIQLDTHERFADELLPLLLKAGPWDVESREAVARLTRWDRRMDAWKPEPLIFEAWQRALVRRLFEDELGDDFKANWSHHPILLLNVLKNVDGQARWCDDVRSTAIEDCKTEIRWALAEALTELRSAYGSDLSQWRWGEAHHALFQHLPFDGIPMLGSIFDREVEAGGGDFVIRRGGFRYSSDRPYAAIHGSGYRAIYDLADPDNSIFVITTGESGNIFSPYYDDQVPLWAAGEYFRIPTSPKAVQESAKYRMTLQPDSASAP
jgi:penicillin amidase